MTDPSLHARASDLFLALRALSPDARARRLAAVAEPALRDEVESLLAHDLPDPPPRPLDAGATIGPYTLLRRLGRGGSGYVFLAEQSAPVQRRVALKIVPQAMLDPVAAARFDFERRALEQIDHPGIARVLDAGRTPDGLPYLVMEHIDGAPITQYCASAGLPLARRLALVIDAADAVQHAHQRGLIHRDLTPANILVAQVNGRPVPRIVDFGIARPIAGRDGPDLTLGSPLGTPAYMAPEQAADGPIDTRADIYALAAILYELARGRPPIPPADDLATTLHNLRTQPPPPITRAALAATIPDRPPRPLLADLNSILARALDKSPQRRYPTADAFADDLRRLLAREPIDARPHTLAYRAARFIERRRPFVAAAAVAALAIILGVAGLSAGLVEARRQHARALDRADALAALNRFLTDDLLAAASPDQSPGDITAVELLDRAARRIDARFPDRPLIAAQMHHTLGLAYTQLGAFNSAERHLDRAVALRTDHAGADAPAAIRSRLALASLLGHRQDFTAAADALSDLLPQARLILGADDPALYAALSDLGSVLDSLGRADLAIPLLEEALAGRRRLLGENDPLVLITLSNLAQAYDGRGDTRRALDLMLQALGIARSLPDEPRMLLIGLNNNIGATYQDLGRHDTAAPYLREASALAERWLGPDNPATLTLMANLAGLEARLGDPARAAEIYRAVADARTSLLGTDAHDTLTARHGLYNSLNLAGRHADAAAGFASLLADTEASLGEDHWLAAQARLSLATALRDAGDPISALPHAARAHARFLALFGPDHPRTQSAAALKSELDAK